MQHRKHVQLARPALGRLGRNEWAVLGTNCGQIQRLARQIIAALGDRYHCVYLDADHAGADADPELPGMLAAGATLEYTDAIHSHQLRINGVLSSHQFRQIFNAADLILANGNHHPAAAQVVVIDPAKENSLRKRLDQLSDVRLILLAEGVERAFMHIVAIDPEQRFAIALHNLAPHPEFVEQGERRGHGDYWRSRSMQSNC